MQLHCLCLVLVVWLFLPGLHELELLEMIFVVLITLIFLAFGEFDSDYAVVHVYRYLELKNPYYQYCEEVYLSLY